MTAAEKLETLRSLEERTINPDTRHSAQAIASILSDDFLEFTASGRVFNKQSVLPALAAENVGTWTEMTNEGYELRQLAEDVVLLTYRHVGKRDGFADARSLRSSIWKMVDGRWQMLFHQGTPMAAD